MTTVCGNFSNRIEIAETLFEFLSERLFGFRNRDILSCSVETSRGTFPRKPASLGHTVTTFLHYFRNVVCN